jgi:hypothetical protein
VLLALLVALLIGARRCAGVWDMFCE